MNLRSGLADDVELLRNIVKVDLSRNRMVSTECL